MSKPTWSELGINEQLTKTLLEQGIQEPTEVQQQAIVKLLAGTDIAVKSHTGSGKTLAFLLPVLQNIDPTDKHVQAVVLAPTQELAMQIVRVAETYAAPLGIKVQQLIGGAAVKRQIEKLKLNPQLVIGTPGRMNELVKLKKLKLHAVKYLIIDEADQTFELGNPADIENLLFSINKKRITAFFSATYPSTMARYEGRWMKQPQKLDLSGEQKVADTIEHYYVVCDKRSKLEYTRRILRTVDASPALLFINDTNQIANWEAKLKYEGFKIEALYGDADKQRRANTLSAFREGKLEAIISTDVAARGIDIIDLPLVIQIEPAIDADHYVHRAGRTGRMGRQGLVISIISPQERFIIEKFAKQLGIEIEERRLFRGKLLTEEQISEAVKYIPNEAKGMKSKVSSSSQTTTAAKDKLSTAKSVNKNDNKPSSKSANRVESGQKVKADSASYKQAGSVKNDKNKKTSPPKKASAIKKQNSKNKGAPKWLKEKWQQKE